MPGVYELTKILLDASVSNIWEEAVEEWHVVGCYDNGDCGETCLCGHEGIRYEYTIENSLNNNKLCPIGSQCILKFGNTDLKKEVQMWDQAIKLLEALRTEGPNRLKDLDSRYFSRHLFAFLYEKGAFPDNQFNKYNGANDRDFMIKMFNKRSEPTEKQKNKIYMILERDIFVGLRRFEDKLKSRSV